MSESRDWSASSSNVTVCRYDETTETLEVTFHHGGRYRYGGVPRLTAAPVLRAVSPAGFPASGYVTMIFVSQPDRFPSVRLA